MGKQKLTHKVLSTKKICAWFAHPLVLGGAMSDMEKINQKYWSGQELTEEDKYKYYKAKAVLFNEISQWDSLYQLRVPISDAKRFLWKSVKAREQSKLYKKTEKISA